MKKIIFVSILILFIIGCRTQPIVPCSECEENTFGEKGLIDVQMYQSAINELDTNEWFWDFWLMNYGKFEAKNIKVKCIVIDEEENELISKTEDIRNIASQSGEFREIAVSITQKFKNLDDDLPILSMCFVVKCDNCDILYKRIPDLVESYESLK